MMMSNNRNNSSKVIFAGGGGSAPSSGYRWSGDAVTLKRRRVGLSNGESMSPGGSGDEEEHEEEEVAPAEEFSEDEDVGGGGPARLPVEDEEGEDEYYDDDDIAASLDHGGRSSSREREAVGYVDLDVGTDDDVFEEEIGAPYSPDVRGRGSDRTRELSSPEDHSPDEGREASEDSDVERALPMPRGVIERSQVTETPRQVVVVPEKAARGMVESVKVETSKRKMQVPPRNGVEPKPKKAKVPAASKKKSNGDGARERIRFSADNKARVTLERAREILASVKAAMMKNPKHFANRHSGTHVVDNSSSSGDERAPMHFPPPRAIQQMKAPEKVVKKKSKAPKGDTEPTPPRSKTKAKTDNKSTEEKSCVRRSSGAGSGHEQSYKVGYYSTAGVETTKEGLEVDNEDYQKKESRDEGYEQRITMEKKVRKRKKPKETENGSSSSNGLCPGSVIRDENWVPPTSPFGLIQESLYKDPWKVLLSCMLLNKTAGRQMHKVIWDLFDLCPDAETAINMDTAKIAEKVYSLGLQNKRAKMIQRFSLEYARGDWTNVTQLHGIGKYATDAYAIFCQGLWREVEPDDVVLAKYWKWLWETEGVGSGFTPDTS